MMRFDGDLLALMLATAKGELADFAAPVFSDDASLVVVVAAKGYPGTPEKGDAIAGLDRAEAEGARIFQAGTALKGSKLVAAGGRVLGVAARGMDVAQAQAAAYRALDAIDFPSGFARRDIGWREIARLKG
jgi:phosphoribosylamine--glycine ligase